MVNAIRTKLRRKLAGLFLRSPVHAVGEHSMIYCTQQGLSEPTGGLIDLGIRAAQRAGEITLIELRERHKGVQTEWCQIWPGEHYRLLAALVDILKPAHITEIGTLTGLSALALSKYLSPTATITTFDIVPWRSLPETCLRESDFADGKLKQELANLAEPTSFERYRPLLETTDLLFVDGPKDGCFEPLFFQQLLTLRRSSRLLVILDDIRVWNMLRPWRDIPHPKLDLTSFGHWSGTGLVEWMPK